MVRCQPEHPPAGASFLCLTGGCEPNLHIELEQAAPTYLAAGGEVTTHKTHELPADGQAQPGSLASLCRHEVAPACRLYKGLKDGLQLLGGDAGAGVLHFKVEGRPPWRAGEGRGGDTDVQRHGALLGELDRVAEKIAQHLAQLALVGHDVAGHVLGPAKAQGQSLLLCPKTEHLLQPVEQAVQVKVRLLQGHPASLDLGHL